MGLYVGLKAMELSRGSQVILPGYTCVVVPSAIQYAGLKPVYIDIDPRTYNLDPVLLEQAGLRPAAALVVQHTYGIPAAMGPLGAWARANEAALLEDCCHVFGTPAEGQRCGTFGKFAFMSGQWNKPFSTGLGGMLLVNDAGLADRVQRIVQEQAVTPGRLRSFVLGCQILAHDLLVRPATAALLTWLYRTLNHWGVVVGSSTEEELQGVGPGQGPPRQYLARMAPCQIRRGLREMARIAENLDHRKRLTEWYHRELPRIGFVPVAPPCREPLPLLRYPVRVANKVQVLSLAARALIEIGSWFEVPLHPAGTRLEDFGYRAGMCPKAERAARQVINLPTHLKVSPSVAERTLEFLRKHARPAE